MTQTYEEMRSEFLAHAGVKGMRWGKRKKEVSVEKQKSRDTKAAGFRAKADEAKKQLEDLDSLGIKSSVMRKAYGSKVNSRDAYFFIATGKTKTNALLDAKKELTRKREIAEENEIAAKEGRLTSGQKKAIIGASVAIGVAVTSVILYKVGSKKVSELKGIYENYEDVASKGPQAIESTYAGGPITYEKFMQKVGSSQSASWGTSKHWSRVGVENLSDLDVQIPKGTSFHRISRQAESKLKDATYATFDKADILRYRAGFTNELGGTGLFDVKIEALDAIRSPSEKKRVQAFIELLDEKVDGRPVREFFGTGASLKGVSNEELAKRAYTQVVGKDFVHNSLAKAYADKIRSMGYNAIIDDMDAGVYGEKPMVLLDNTVLKIAKTTPLLQADIDAARAALTEIIQRKT